MGKLAHSFGGHYPSTVVLSYGLMLLSTVLWGWLVCEVTMMMMRVRVSVLLAAELQVSISVPSSLCYFRCTTANIFRTLLIGSSILPWRQCTKALWCGLIGQQTASLRNMDLQECAGYLLQYFSISLASVQPSDVLYTLTSRPSGAQMFYFCLLMFTKCRAVVDCFEVLHPRREERWRVGDSVCVFTQHNRSLCQMMALISMSGGSGVCCRVQWLVTEISVLGNCLIWRRSLQLIY